MLVVSVVAVGSDLFDGKACFTEETLIYTKDGYKQIKDIAVGDEVYSKNPETGEQGLKKVINVFVKEVKELIHLKVGDQEIKTTATHPFWVEGRGWADAGELKPGDRLVMYSGEMLEVKEAFVECLDKPIKVYNFEVEDWHTYFVSVYNVFVHNAGCGDGVGGSSGNKNYRGGKHGDTKSPAGDELDSHHMPAKQASPLDPDDGPAIQMDPADHRRTASYGGREGSPQQAYRDKQKNLIDQGKFDDAFLMDVDDVQSKFGNKYNEAILEAIGALPKLD